MKKFFLSLAVFVMAICANAQKNQYFWYQGNLMMGNPIAQIDSVTFGEGEPVDTLHIMLPRTIIKTVHDTVYITIHDTVCPNDIPEGALAGEFSVSATKKVRFSKGNLQYNAALGTHQCADGTTKQGTWRFTENQYDTLDIVSQSQKAESYDGWIDVFAWGTSSWNSGANKYQPWEVSGNDPNNYIVGGNENNDLTGNYSYADWGVYNAISNGGNQPLQWRTLSKDEWSYILTDRPNAINLCSYANIDGVVGMILLPDNYILPSGVNFVPNIKAPDGNQYSLAEWKLLERNGAVFLPHTNGYNFTTCDGWGYHLNVYWTSTHRNYYSSYSVHVGRLSVYDDRYRCDSGSVRLVQDIE